MKKYANFEEMVKDYEDETGKKVSDDEKEEFKVKFELLDRLSDIFEDSRKLNNWFMSDNSHLQAVSDDIIRITMGVCASCHAFYNELQGVLMSEMFLDDDGDEILDDEEDEEN